jgi:hypothetical protein
MLHLQDAQDHHQQHGVQQTQLRLRVRMNEEQEGEEEGVQFQRDAINRSLTISQLITLIALILFSTSILA